MAPLHVTAPGVAVQNARGDEKNVREPVEIASRRGAHLFLAAQSHHAALGTPADRAREVRGRRGARAARQDELLQRRERAVPMFEALFQTLNLRFAEKRMAGNADLAAEVEEIVLHVREELRDFRR